MDDEIDLGKIILDLWEGKRKIITSTIIVFIIMNMIVKLKMQGKRLFQAWIP